MTNDRGRNVQIAIHHQFNHGIYTSFFRWRARRYKIAVKKAMAIVARRVSREIISKMYKEDKLRNGLYLHNKMS